MPPWAMKIMDRIQGKKNEADMTPEELAEVREKERIAWEKQVRIFLFFKELLIDTCYNNSTFI